MYDQVHDVSRRKKRAACGFDLGRSTARNRKQSNDAGNTFYISRVAYTRDGNVISRRTVSVMGFSEDYLIPSSSISLETEFLAVGSLSDAAATRREFTFRWVRLHFRSSHVHALFFFSFFFHQIRFLFGFRFLWQNCARHSSVIWNWLETSLGIERNTDRLCECR